uniref:Uncharacterized protein n=1 Tax=Ciona intestinalis TaxID=7719 RepID=H2XQH4_CIOIN
MRYCQSITKIKRFIKRAIGNLNFFLLLSFPLIKGGSLYNLLCLRYNFSWAINRRDK